MRVSAAPKPSQEIHVGPLIESSIHLDLRYVAIAEFVQECDRSLGWPLSKPLELLSAVPRVDRHCAEKKWVTVHPGRAALGVEVLGILGVTGRRKLYGGGENVWTTDRSTFSRVP